jgi:DNA (cytosine-5)-methyltransferase 1
VPRADFHRESEPTPNSVPRAGAADLDDADHAFLRRREITFLEASGDIAVVDLFSGCGGLTIGALEGARRVGRRARLALAVDHAAAPLGVLSATLGGSSRRYRALDLGSALLSIEEQVTSGERQLFAAVEGPSILLAGPPCQGHSTLNNHTRHDDPRNDLYLAVARAAQVFEPRVVVVENVRGVGSDRRSAVARCHASLQRLGYEVVAKRIDLHALGVPQTRIRHVLVATRKKPFVFEFANRSGRSVAWAIDDLLGSTRSTMFDSASRPSEVNAARIDWLFTRGRYDLPNDRRPVCHQSDHSYRSMYGRLRWDAPAQTVTSGFGSMGQGRYVHPKERRTLTPHEAARLQCLPDFMSFAGVTRRTALAEMIGNVAPPLLSAALVEALVRQDLL